MFMSSDEGSHRRTVTFLFWNQSLAMCDVCFGSLSCWKITLPLPIFFNFWSLRVPRRLCQRISTYPGPFMIPLMWWSLPIPSPVIQPHTITFPPPCLIVFFMKWGFRACPGFIQNTGAHLTWRAWISTHLRKWPVSSPQQSHQHLQLPMPSTWLVNNPGNPWVFLGDPYL